jgi:uncharacterized protein (TIGR04540 family)
MSVQYLKNPKTVKGLASEIKNICDDYWSRKIQENLAIDFIIQYATYDSDKFFRGSELNPTLVKILGKKRVELVNKFLQGTQYTFLSK